eukprot:2681290-Alexandrium_andersonii.AAC.1
MSASLVGSEMCIRDSHCAIVDAARRSRRAVGVFGQQPSRRFDGVVASVSYTHLTLPTICSV